MLTYDNHYRYLNNDIRKDYKFYYGNTINNKIILDKKAYKEYKNLPVYTEKKQYVSPSIEIKEKTLKYKCKEKIKNKFKVGEYYYLRGKTADGSKREIKEFIVKKIIYKINNEEVNSLVVKQISGINNSIFTLNKYDCKKLHIKYEPGLQIYSMLLNWIKKNENYK